MDFTRGLAEPSQIASPAALSPAAVSCAAPKDLPARALPGGEPRATRIDTTWLDSSFDLAQGLDVKVMESKLSRETLDSLFRA